MNYKRAVCKFCDSYIWKTEYGKTWYTGDIPGERSTEKARCLAGGNTSRKHSAARGTIGGLRRTRTP